MVGPYRSGVASAAQAAANLTALNRATDALCQRGHAPLLGVNLALPIITAMGDETCDAVMLPLAVATAARCDAVLRIGGASAGADREAASFRARGLPVCLSLGDVPAAAPALRE